MWEVLLMVTCCYPFQLPAMLVQMWYDYFVINFVISLLLPDQEKITSLKSGGEFQHRQFYLRVMNFLMK